MEIPSRVLVADDDRTIRRNLVLLLRSEGYETLEAADGAETLASIRNHAPDAVLLDLKMPGRDGLEVLAELRSRLADLPVIVITAFGGSSAAIEAIRRGAYDYLSKPFDLDEVLLTLKRALRQRALAIEVKSLRDRAAEATDDPDEDLDTKLIGQSPAMREVFKAIGRASATDAPVLVIGESGTGKELIATALHHHSARASGPFIRVNCGALPEGLIESELFGHERGAFTGADRQKPGRFERATGGTIFLDEIGELPLSAQAKILRVIQHREFERVGGTATSRRKSPAVDFARISIIDSTWPGSSFRRSAIDPRISRHWPSTSSEGSSANTAGGCSRSRPRPSRPSSRNPGRGMSGNSKTPWREPRSPLEVGSSCQNIWITTSPTTHSSHCRPARRKSYPSEPCSPKSNGRPFREP
jgi:DNA-binding response OmpR family regulator